ncbi:MAG: hypothetical protein ABIB43_04855 [archaeon]
MKVYLANKTSESFIKEFENLSNVKVNYEINSNILNQKDCFLIDVYNTFIKPVTTIDDDMTMERLGKMAYLRGEKVSEDFIIKGQPVRKGFKEFLKHYNDVKIGIHSDSIYDNQFQELHDYWGFEGLVEKYFYEITGIPEKEWMFKNSNKMDSKYFIQTWDNKKYIKDFKYMIQAMNTNKENTLIIGDGLTDITPAVHYNIDLLVVPPQTMQPNFDFKELIK